MRQLGDGPTLGHAAARASESPAAFSLRHRPTAGEAVDWILALGGSVVFGEADEALPARLCPEGAVGRREGEV